MTEPLALPAPPPPQQSHKEAPMTEPRQPTARPVPQANRAAGRAPALGRGLARRWPALAGAALVTALVPVGIALADDFGPSVFTASGAQTALRAVVAVPGTGTAIFAGSGAGTAVDASGGPVGVKASGTTAVRARTFNPGGVAVDAGTNDGDPNSPATAVKARSGTGPALDAQSHTVAVRASIGSSTGASIAVDAGGTTGGATTGVKAGGSSAGVDAVGGAVGVKAASTDGVGVEATGGQIAVRAQSPDRGVLAQTDNGDALIGNSTRGNGLTAVSANAYPAELIGSSRAQLRLRPASTVGKPPAVSGIVHQVGELFMDSQGQLFLCTVQGTPGTWVKVAVTPAP